MHRLMVIAGALLLLVGLGAAPARAGGFEVQNELTVTPETLTVTTAAVHTSTPTTALQPIACGGNPTLYVSALTSTYPATVTIRVELYSGASGSLTWIGTAYVGTVTFGAAGASSSSGGVYYPDSAIVATSCRTATYADVRVTAISATTTVTLKRWVGQAAANGVAQ